MNKANPSTFKLTFPMAPSQESFNESKDFFVHLYQNVLPSIDFEENEQHFQGNRYYGSPLGVNYGTFSTTFFIDENFNNYLFIYDWMMGMNNGIDVFHGKSMLKNQIDTRLMIMDNFMRTVVSFKFANMFPNSLGEVSLSYQEGESFLTCDVEFLYDYFIKE